MELEPLHLTVAFMAGMALGLFYFGSLWLTVRHVPRSRHPVAIVFGSLLGRTAVVLPAFFFVMGDGWERLVACLVGFILIRQVMLRVVGFRSLQQNTQDEGTPA